MVRSLQPIVACLALASIVATPGGEAAQIRGTVLAVLKKVPDGSWKVFRAIGM